MKDKKKIALIISIVLISALLIFIFIKNKKNNITFMLNGEVNMTIDYGTTFVDPGFIAKDGFGNDISENVTVTNNIDTLVSGTNKIDYILNYNGKTISLYRIVIVQKISAKDLKIVLNGDEVVYLLRNNEYQEEGAYLLNTISNKEYNSGYIDISNNVNTNEIGNYEVIYSYVSGGTTINAIRKVVVFDIEYTVNPAILTSSKVKINLNISDFNMYMNTKLPSGEISSSRNIEYEVSNNGEYTFIINLLNNMKYKKIVTVNNIVDNYTCTGEITNTGTKITVSPTSSRIKEYEWNINNEIIKGTNIYQKGKIISKAKVNLVFENNEKYEVNCSIQDKLVYHFKYDENNTKPYMKCNTYTAQDKVRLDAQLKKVVADAGYGTRAGVVEAARFLVGALDYKVKYLGPKTVNSALGRYNKVGLNIGQSGAWGCSVSGYTQGMDCTNFVSWVYRQNGIDNFPYNTKHSATRDVINQIKVGDLLYTPCTSAECKNNWKLNHVGIIVGIDDNYIYVAEATTGSIEAIVVTKWEKHNMPSSGKFSRVHLATEYNGDGNLTNMWMSE